MQVELPELQLSNTEADTRDDMQLRSKRIDKYCENEYWIERYIMQDQSAILLALLATLPVVIDSC